ncbi:hypothetical protein BIZ37_25580 [Photobacterium sp. BZF1]|uniref:hypothetical protein n=1 Tax=Photobacterium sp. BZF1 TaxID=1904457 RepID=UPI001653A6B1|nr:hypothetical protein [Photobacterium sp. BZF1]MBC7005935.1 hypothetical protein [Photobacterium sp. BZF1]
MKTMFLAMTLALTVTSVKSTELEVSFVYSDAYIANPEILVSSEIIGFYRSLDAANILLEDQGAEMKLIPARVSAIDKNIFWPGQITLHLVNSMNYNDPNLAIETNNSGHFIVGLAEGYQSTVYWYRNSVRFNYDKYELFEIEGAESVNTKKSAIHKNIMNGISNSYPNYQYMLLQRVLESMGAYPFKARASKEFDVYGIGEDYGYGTSCPPNFTTPSLMNNVHLNQVENMMITGSDDCKVENADMVRFINTYAPKVAQHEPYLDMATLDIVAKENTQENTFDFTVTRTKLIDKESVVYLHLSGSNPTYLNEVEPFEVQFKQSQTESTVSIPFSYIHPLFDDAQYVDGKVFAVGVSDSEVSPKLIDLSDLNTQWPENNSGSGGASLSLWVLLGLFASPLLRMKS